MRRAHAVLLALAGAPATAGPVRAAPQTVANGTHSTDRPGRPGHAHGGGVLKAGAYYHWCGEHRDADNTFRSVDAHRSTDPKNRQENASTVSQENRSASAAGRQWSVTTTGSCVTVASRATGECPDVNGGSTADSAAIITYTCNGGTNQQWTRGT
ncbi:RICIN domain-containing protein [Streptomyces pimonensis]|uniref:RICIN domain-containing protein n=1 Tax=Streptomyces pimonensis TaxID=2860288 RepID=A0ABV4IWM1_9ACTN